MFYHFTLNYLFFKTIIIRLIIICEYVIRLEIAIILIIINRRKKKENIWLSRLLLSAR